MEYEVFGRKSGVDRSGRSITKRKKENGMQFPFLVGIVKHSTTWS